MLDGAVTLEMSEFVDADDTASAPADDTEAFVHYAARAGVKFARKSQNLRGDQDDWDELNHLRFRFHSYILVIGDIYNVVPFSDDIEPDVEDYGEKEWRRFNATFDRRMAKLVHRKAREARSDSFLLTEVAKKGLRTHLSGLRKYINESEFPDATKKKLLAKVDEFEAALHERRMSMNFVYGFIGVVVGTIGLVADASTIGDSSIVGKLMKGMAEAAVEAKAETETILALVAPARRCKSKGQPRALRRKRGSLLCNRRSRQVHGNPSRPTSMTRYRSEADFNIDGKYAALDK